MENIRPRQNFVFKSKELINHLMIYIDNKIHLK